MQKWNKSTYRAQRVDEKNNVIHLVMFTFKVMIIRMSKIAHLMYFLLNAEKNIPSLGKIFKCIGNVLFDPFTKYYGLWSSDLPLANCQHLKIQQFSFSFFFLDISTHNISRTITSKAYLNIPFSARTWWVLPHVLKDITQTVTNFLLLSGENKNN